MRKYMVIGIVLAAVALFATYYVFRYSQNTPAAVIQTPTPTSTPIVSPTPIPTPELIDYGAQADRVSPEYIELYPVIEGQQGYIAFPRTITKDSPPAIVVYYHGSSQLITTNFKDSVMKNMRLYGEFFSKNNIAFLASNQHGDNWGNKIAVEDTRKLVDYVRKKFVTNSTVYVLGFSMGGMPAMRHVIMYPKEVSRIALLAPAQQVETYTAAQIRLFKQVPLKVWHGTSDVNVPYWVTEELQTYFRKYEVPLVVNKLKGKTHWDVDVEYRTEVLDWYLTEKEE